jgi:hypothetical protein
VIPRDWSRSSTAANADRQWISLAYPTDSGESVSDDPKFEKLFGELPESYAATARALRAAIRTTAPHLVESVRWNNPFWTGRNPVFCLQCYPDHVNFGVMRGAELASAYPRIEGTGKSMRHVEVANAKDARSPELARIIRAAVELDGRS